MSIASEISRLNTAKADIKAVLEGKGITVPSSLKIDGYAELIESFVLDIRVVAKFNVADTSSPTQIISENAQSPFGAIEIDGVVQPSVVSEYTFSTTGEHTVKYTLTDTTSIGSNVFNGCTNLTSVTIPNSVTSIGDGAFSRCTGLTSITIPNSVTSIENWAFEGCSGLTSVHITDIAAWCNISFSSGSSNPLSYAHHLYMNGSEITDLVIPNSVTSIGIYAFRNCSGLTSVTIPNSVTSIGQGAFYGCSGLTSITIPNSVTSIGSNVFSGCTNLTSVTIPNSVTSIGNHAFRNCVKLYSIISNATTAPTIQSATFRDVKTGGTLTVPTGSTGYDVWMGTDSYYLGKYYWTKVEQ